MMDDENGDDKKESDKNPAFVNGSVSTTGVIKVIEKKNLSTVVSNCKILKADAHNPVSAFTRQVVHGMKSAQILTKTKSVDIGNTNTAGNKIGLANMQAPNVCNDIKKMVDKALKARLYFLQQTGPHQFLIGGDSPDHKYRVTIGSQKCNCGKDGFCVHILFVMLRVFRVPVSDPILSKRPLKNFQVETLLRNFSVRRSSKMKSISRTTSIRKDQSKSSADATDGANASSSPTLACPNAKDSSENVNLGNENSDETCPICLLELVEGESLTECKNGCQNKYHQHCIAIWMQECSQQKEPVVCPLCRAPWNRLESAAAAAATGGAAAQRVGCAGALFLDELPPDFRNVVSGWVKSFGGDLVQKLLSKNWTDREIGLRRFSEEVGTTMLLGVGTSDAHQDGWMTTFESAISVISHLLLDPVYKVFVAALRSFRVILFYTPCQCADQQSYLRFTLKPFVKSLFVKCSDSNKKTGQLALSTMEEFIKGQEGELAVGKDIPNSESLCMSSLDYILDMILFSEDSHSDAEEWQLVYGKLIILHRLVEIFPNMFLRSKPQSGPPCECQGSVVRDRSIYGSQLTGCFHSNKDLFLDFLLRYLPHSHVRISKSSRLILLSITRLNVEDNDSYHHILSHVSNSSLIDSALKEALLSKLLRIEEELNASDDCRRSDSPADAYRRLSVPIIQVEKALRSRSRPSSGRIGIFRRGDSFRMAGIKSSTPSSQESWSRKNSFDKRRCFKKHMSVSDDSVFTRSMESGNYLLSPVVMFSSQDDSVLGRRSECSPITPRCLFKGGSEFSVLIKKQNWWSGKSRSEKPACHTTYRDASTSTSPPPIPGTNPPLAGKSKNGKAFEFLHLKHCRHSSAGSTREVGDLISSTPVTEKVSFKTEVATTPHPSPEHTLEDMCHCKEEVDKEEAEALARALDLSDAHQELLPFVPGLTVSNPQTMSQSLMEELKDTRISWTSFTTSSNSNICKGDVAAAALTSPSYEENVHWKRGPIIGSGAACTCYQARDMKTGTLMAVKLISFCRNTEDEQNKVKKMIVDEVHTMAQLNHPNIVRILGATLQTTHVLMFFEWMPGRSITSLLELYGPFSEQVVTKYTIQILRGLVYLHDNHILHRDLKGANILVDSTGQRLRIGDFGTSARLTSSKTLQGEFQGQLLGTVAFMAPEVLRGGDYGRSCDIWSLGCCVIEMLTGSPPWVSKHLSNHLALMFKIASSDKPPTIPDNLNPALKDFLLRCLDIIPSDRPVAKDLLKHPLFRI